jgi:hypothetical protein
MTTAFAAEVKCREDILLGASVIASFNSLLVDDAETHKADLSKQCYSVIVSRSSNSLKRGQMSSIISRGCSK